MDDRDIQIRRMIHDDIPIAMNIETESFADPWNREVLEEAVSVFPDTVFIAESGGEVVGFVICGVEDTGEEIYGHICSLAVRKASRRGGIGTCLVKRAEYSVMMQGATGMQLEVRVTNQNAQRFYCKHGYQPIFQLCGYYQNTEDAIVMMKWFKF